MDLAFKKPLYSVTVWFVYKVCYVVALFPFALVCYCLCHSSFAYFAKIVVAF